MGVLALLLLSVGIASATPPGGTVTNYTGPGISQPFGIAAGPDGALWFTNASGNSIGRITTAGTVTAYHPAGIHVPFGIVAGPDGALWFGNTFFIGRITTAGAVTNYTGPGISQPYGIATGPDGALWFTNNGNNSIGRISPTGAVTNYTGTGFTILEPFGIAAGPDGALWFTNGQSNTIGRITTTGTVTNYTGTGISAPVGIAAGPDGALWFTNSNHSIGRITTTGTVTNYTGTGISQPWEIAAGPDCALWFTNMGNNSIGRIQAFNCPTNISLGPATATNPVGTTHTVTATVTTPPSTPVPNVVVTFKIVCGPNSGVTGSATTNSAGVATFTYTGNGGPGTDCIKATFVDKDGKTVTSKQVKKVWTAITLDHFQCYVPRKTPPHLLGVASLQDQFDGKKFEQVKVMELYRFCNPVRKVFSGKVTPIAHDKLHLAIYSIATKPTRNHSLLIANQFGQQKIVVGPPRWLAVPSSKNSTTPPDTKLLSHFKCYPVIKGRAVNVAVDLTDQWNSEKGVRAGLQVIFCNPARKVHAGRKYPIVNSVAHLLCYRLAAKPFPKSAFILNQFGQADIAVVGADVLCVPSRILGPPPPPPPPPPAQDACAEFPKTLVSGAGNTAFSTDGKASFSNIAFAVAPNPIWNVIDGTSWVSLTRDGRSPSKSSTTIYRRSFNVSRYTLAHAVLSLSGSALADNSAKVSFNGQTLAQQPSGSPASNYKTPTPFNYQGSPGKTNFQLSDNLDFTVTDEGEVTGVDYSVGVTCKAG